MHVSGNAETRPEPGCRPAQARFQRSGFRADRTGASYRRWETLPLAATVERAIAPIKRLVIACVAVTGAKPVPDAAADILEGFKTPVKGEPAWHAIRDNCRELVYCRNCINMGREDTLPKAPEKMAVRTARHEYLYVKTRCIRERRLEC